MIEVDEILAMLQAIYGRLLTIEGPVPYRDMTQGERDALLAQYKDELERDIAAFETAIDRHGREAAAGVINRFRVYEGIDAEALDDFLEAAGEWQHHAP